MNKKIIGWVAGGLLTASVFVFGYGYTIGSAAEKANNASQGVAQESIQAMQEQCEKLMNNPEMHKNMQSMMNSPEMQKRMQQTDGTAITTCHGNLDSTPEKN